MKYALPILAALVVGCNPVEDIFPEPDGGTTSQTDTTSDTTDTMSSDSTTTDGTTSETTTGEVGGEVSGSRIRLKYRIGDDGVKVNAGTYDSLLKTDCVFLSASDNVTRCVPYQILAGGRFSDAACTTPVVFRAACQAAAPAFITTSEGPCPALAHVYETGLLWVGPTYAKQGDGTCVLSPLPPDYEVFLLGPEMAASEFVGSSVVTE